MQKHHIGFFFSIFLLSAVIFSFWYFNPLQLWAQTGPPSYGCPQTSGEKKCTPDYALTSASSENPPCKTSAELKVLSDSCFASGGTGFNCGCQYPTPPGGDGGSCKKICSVVVDENWRDTFCVPSSWKTESCLDHAYKVSAFHFMQVGCITKDDFSFSNSYNLTGYSDLEPADGKVPAKNCGWEAPKASFQMVFEWLGGVEDGNTDESCNEWLTRVGKKGLYGSSPIVKSSDSSFHPGFHYNSCIYRDMAVTSGGYKLENPNFKDRRYKPVSQNKGGLFNGAWVYTLRPK